MKKFLLVLISSLIAFSSAIAQPNPRYVPGVWAVTSQGGGGVPVAGNGINVVTNGNLYTIEATGDTAATNVTFSKAGSANITIATNGYLYTFDLPSVLNLLSYSNANFVDLTNLSTEGRIIGRFKAGSAANSSSITFGSPSNYIEPSVFASVISGGGETQTDAYYTNRIFSSQSVIAGGVGNHIGLEALGSAIGGGELNSINKDSGVLDSSYSTISGGEVNKIQEDSRDGFIGGGYRNIIGESSIAATIAGGYLNSSTGAYSAILGGYLNKVNGTRAMAIGSYLTNTTDGSVMLGYGLSRVSILTNYTIAWPSSSTNSSNSSIDWNVGSVIGMRSDSVSGIYSIKDLQNSGTLLFAAYTDLADLSGGHVYLKDPVGNFSAATNSVGYYFADTNYVSTNVVNSTRLVYSTNALASLNIDVTKSYQLLPITSNTTLTGVSGKVATEVKHAVLMITNGTANVYSLTLPTSWRTSDGLRTYYVTNAQMAILSVNCYGNLFTNAVCINTW
jgi:hypothetical protein